MCFSNNNRPKENATNQTDPSNQRPQNEDPDYDEPYYIYPNWPSQNSTSANHAQSQHNEPKYENTANNKVVGDRNNTMPIYINIDNTPIACSRNTYNH